MSGDEHDYADELATPGEDPRYCQHCGHPIRSAPTGCIHAETLSPRCRAFTT